MKNSFYNYKVKLTFYDANLKIVFIYYWYLKSNINKCVYFVVHFFASKK